MTALWWQTGVIYEIYLRSFQDTNGDGIGDLKGIEQRLDYLASLGVDAIWISPIYPSPMADFGYDVADYCDVDPRFGALAHFDDLLAQAHSRLLKVLLDFVPNHTSDRHPWFAGRQTTGPFNAASKVCFATALAYRAPELRRRSGDNLYHGTVHTRSPRKGPWRGTARTEPAIFQPFGSVLWLGARKMR